MTRFQKLSVNPQSANALNRNLDDLIGNYVGLDDDAFGAALERDATQGGLNGRVLREGETFLRLKPNE